MESDNTPLKTRRGFNIDNPNRRPVICINNEDNEWGGADHASSYLNVGQIYHVSHIEMHSWHTRVYLVEFPNHWFNSVAFGEL